MKTFLVTGGCGFIGSHLCDKLTGLGHQVRVLDDLSTGHASNISSNIELIEGDVADQECVRQAMRSVDGCFHLAAIASVQRSVEDWLGSHHTNLTGAITVFNEARRSMADSIPVAYASSAAVYGDCDQVPLSEESPVRPITAYGADKLGCELHARVASLVHGVPTCGLRFFNVFGPRQDPRSPYSGVISIFFDRLLAGQELIINGHGRQLRDFVYVADVVDHLIAAMASMGRAPRVFNVCRGRGTSIHQLADLVGETLDITPTIIFAPFKAGDILVSIGDPSLAIATLGVRATTSLRQGLQRTAASLSPAIAAIAA